MSQTRSLLLVGAVALLSSQCSRRSPPGGPPVASSSAPPAAQGAASPAPSSSALSRVQLTGVIGYGIITLPNYPEAKLSRAAWLDFVHGEALLKARDSFSGINPFTREPVVFDVPGSAQVVQNGTAVGMFIWQDGRVFADGDEAVLTPIALRCAKALNARFEDEDGNPIQP